MAELGHESLRLSGVKRGDVKAAVADPFRLSDARLEAKIAPLDPDLIQDLVGKLRHGREHWLSMLCCFEMFLRKSACECQREKMD